MVIVIQFTKSPTGALPMQRILVVVVLAALALAACSKQPAEITANDQVPADQRTASASEGAGGGASEGAGGGGDATWVAVDIDFESAPETLPAGETTITLTNRSTPQRHHRRRG